VAIIDDLVSADWLAANLGRPDIKILDGTWYPPGDDSQRHEWTIPGAFFFDIDDIADKNSPFTHMLPTPETFANAVSATGIDNDDHVIVYDQQGIFSSPRLWWTFKMFGHENVSVLDGGLLAWLDGQYPTESEFSQKAKRSNYQVQPPLSKVISSDSILEGLGGQTQILDARSSGRFYGTAPEPRDNLRSGHIPGSLSLPYASLLRPDKRFLDLADIAEKFGLRGVDLSAPIITSCGSGITAAILAFNLHRLGAKDVSVYDASWAQWGSSDLPISLED
jgi:thiosulfate/3-mercaptopyruvate sulfurtransferase